MIQALCKQYGDTAGFCSKSINKVNFFLRWMVSMSWSGSEIISICEDKLLKKPSRGNEFEHVSKETKRTDRWWEERETDSMKNDLGKSCPGFSRSRVISWVRDCSVRTNWRGRKHMSESEPQFSLLLWSGCTKWLPRSCPTDSLLPVRPCTVHLPLLPPCRAPGSLAPFDRWID